jgi:hypothetical protein
MPCKAKPALSRNLVVRNGIREAAARDLLDEDDLRRLIQVAQEGTEIATT